MNPKNMKTPLKILKEYNLSEKDVVFIKEPKENKVWVIHDTKNKRRLVLKAVKKDNSSFPILLHHQLFKIGFSVPKVFETTKGQVYVQTKKKFYYVSEYINNLEPINEQQRIEGLAEFHSHAKFEELISFNEKNFFPNKENLKSYSDKLDEIKKWTSSVSSPTLKDIINEITKIGLSVYHLMQTCDIEGYLQQTSKRNSICHGDFNMNNAFTTENKEFLIIDFDHAYFGSPLDDFRFLMMSITRNSKNDPLSKLNPLFENYFKVCSEDLPYKDIYKADSMFPHEFHKQVKQIVEQEKIKKSSNYQELLVQLAEREKSKYEFLIKGSEVG
ncbi:phosphotransferase [Peribacillus sp. NJ11]|uniref:phosphotransferase n=1 Tax=Peribacillus sp. NJ11 TaxID=3055861 RepID=UPI0025A2F929|nr:phosphotransferase [Peribacillus sp. NJ11]MDM5224314.1 phosphotransferase [Peribacillus sp. NJ11]